MIDGDAYTPIYAYANSADLDFLRYDVTSASNVLRPTGTACIIGVGGGRDVLTALNFGHQHVLGIEINPAMVGLLRRFADTSPVLPRPARRDGGGRRTGRARGVQRALHVSSKHLAHRYVGRDRRRRIRSPYGSHAVHARSVVDLSSAAWSLTGS